MKKNFKTGLLVGMNVVLMVIVLTGAVTKNPSTEGPNEIRATDPMLGEIYMFAGTFAPRGYALCNGQLLAISQHTALFSLLGTTYGGDGRTTFALPDLRGRVPIHAGQGPGLTPYRLGAKGGSETMTITTAQLPSHNHGINVAPASLQAESPNAIAVVNSTAASSATIGDAGGSQPVDIRQPYQAINYIIALNGTFPSRN